MKTQKIIIISIILLLMSSSFYFGFKCFSLQEKLNAIELVTQETKESDDVLTFAKIFLRDVLKAEKEVDFETRLELENKVRNLKDKEILDQWQKFVGSQDEVQAQTEVKNLLELLLNKIK